MWYLLLGFSGFFLFYVPTYITSVLFFNHFNYFTHRPRNDGTFEILNIDRTPYQRLVNHLFFGVFYHKNHHLKPYLFNPKNMNNETDEPLISNRQPRKEPLVKSQ